MGGSVRKAVKKVTKPIKKAVSQTTKTVKRAAKTVKSVAKPPKPSGPSPAQIAAQKAAREKKLKEEWDIKSNLSKAEQYKKAQEARRKGFRGVFNKETGEYGEKAKGYKSKARKNFETERELESRLGEQVFKGKELFKRDRREDTTKEADWNRRMQEKGLGLFDESRTRYEEAGVNINEAGKGASVAASEAYYKRMKAEQDRATAEEEKNLGKVEKYAKNWAEAGEGFKKDTEGQVGSKIKKGSRGGGAISTAGITKKLKKDKKATKLGAATTKKLGIDDEESTLG